MTHPSRAAVLPQLKRLGKALAVTEVKYQLQCAITAEHFFSKTLQTCDQLDQLLT